MADGWQNNDSDRPIEEQEATTEMQMIDSGDPLFLFFCTHLAISQCYSNLRRISQSLAIGSINALCNSGSPYGNMFPVFPLCSRDPWTGGLPESRRVHWSTCGLMEWKTALWWMSTFRLCWVVYKILNLQRYCFSNLFIDAISLDLPPHP